MFPLIPLAIGGTIGAGVIFVNRRKPDNLVATLSAPKIQPSPAQQPNALALTTSEVTKRLVAFEEKYQLFVQANIDPLFGKTRQGQLYTMLGGKRLEISVEERFANRRIGIGTLALGSALIGQLIFPPFTIVAILLGASTVWTLYYFAYLEWQRTHRLSSLHLICTYIAFLWLGGYASIGAFGSLLVGISLKIKAITENQSRNNLINIFQLQPSKVWVRNNGLEIEIPFEQVQIGDIVVLQAGQVVPIDGTIVAGNATIDQHMLTGEAQPVERAIGDGVLASTVLIAGKIDVHVEKTGNETTAGQIGQILNQTAQYNTSVGLRVMQLSDRFVWPTLALSAIGLPLVGPAGAVSLMGANSTVNTYMTGTLTILNFLNLAAKQGILVKDGSALERLNLVDTIVFDKTGTLTLEQPQVAKIHQLSDLSADGILRLAAAAEARQSHPIARAILAAAAARNLSYPAVDEAHYEAGLGLKVRLAAAAIIAGQLTESTSAATATPLIRVGSTRFMTMEGIALPSAVNRLVATCEQLGHSLIMVAVDEQVVGSIELQPTVRPEAAAIVNGLRARGLALYIISGDQDAPTRKLSQELGMTGYFAEVLPEGKADLVEQLQQKGQHVCFIGDGINDAIAMRKAEVSISLRGATTAATDTAQIILMEGNLGRLLELFQMSEELNQNLKHNFRFTAGVSIAAMTGILLAGFTFAATEVLYTVSLLGGLAIAMKPLLDQQKSKADN